MPLFPHGGHCEALARKTGRAARDILDFSANINPLGPPDWLRPVILGAVANVARYPDPDCAALLAAASDRYGLPVSRLVAGNGASDLLFTLPRACGLSRAALFAPCYVDYETACRKAGLEVSVHALSPETDFIPVWDDLAALAADPRPTLIIVGSPNNPTGAAVPAQALRRLAAERPDCLIVADEAFADFDPKFDSLTRNLPENCAVLLSLTKMFAIPGLRLGLLAGSEALCARMRALSPPWQVNALAQAVGERALRDAGHPERTRAVLPGLRDALAHGLSALPGLRVFPSRANYLLCRLETGTAAALCERLLANHGVALRDCANYRGLDGRYFRTAVRSAEENARLLTALRAELPPAPVRGGGVPAPARRQTPALMFQGTSSNAGKSLLAAAMCRILRQDGYGAAPFKAQNMSLNSFVTADGGEMGRAQVLQAQACRLAPDVRMNPVLLKPSSDVGSQVIVLGKPVGVMRVMEYVRYKPEAAAAARAAYDELAGEHEIMIIEGAGSPAEVNLKAHDMVNMAMARYANARVLLVSDIDRGGSFASLLGTMECLTEAERALVDGYVLNRFRGDPGLLGEAFDFMRQTTGREVLGVVPEIVNHGLPEEDSVSFKAAALFADKPGAVLDLALVDLPHISNFTDLDALAAEPDVRLRVIRRPEDLDRVPDALILPGSKNTVADLAALDASGLADRLRALAASGETEIAGVCAGLQMLGLRVDDPLGLETDRGGADGLGLLPIETRLAVDKTLLLTRATHAPTGERLSGYEIHHGETRALGACETAVRREDGTPIGFAAPGRRVWGSYLHGIFDADGFRRVWLDGLRAKKGLPPSRERRAYDLEPALDRLADVVRESLSMKKIRALLGL